MPWWARLLIHYGAPLVAEAVSALIRSLSAHGNDTDRALMVASDIVRGLDHSEVPVEERRATAHAAIASYLRHESGEDAPAATVNALLELALVRVRNAPA